MYSEISFSEVLSSYQLIKSTDEVDSMNQATSVLVQRIEQSCDMFFNFLLSQYSNPDEPIVTGLYTCSLGCRKWREIPNLHRRVQRLMSAMEFKD